MAKRKDKITLIAPFFCKDGKIIFDDAESIRKFCELYDGMRGVADLQALTDMAEKERIFRYLFGALLPTATTLLAHAGYSDLSTSDVYLILKDRYAKEPWYDPIEKKEKFKHTDFSASSTTTGQLCDFIDKVIFFIEGDLKGEAPRSEDWHIRKRLGWRGETI